MGGEAKTKGMWALNSGPLSEQRLFRWALVSLTILVLATLVASVWDLPFDFSSAGVRSFLTHIKDVVPIAVLAVAIIVLIARAHATVQAAEQISKAVHQINISESQNSFNNYIAHVKMFNEKCSEGLSGQYSFDIDGLYRRLFPNNSHARFEAIAVEEALLEFLGSVYALQEFLGSAIKKQSFSMDDLDNYLPGCFIKLDPRSRFNIRKDGPHNISYTKITFLGDARENVERVVRFAGMGRIKIPDAYR